MHKRFEKQGRVILARDGLQPDVGHELLWAIGEVISGEVLAARALLSSSQEDLSRLLTDANMGGFGLLVQNGLLCGQRVRREDSTHVRV